MRKPWPEVPLGDLLRKTEEWIDLDPAATYTELTVRLWGKGVATRRLINGAAIAASRRMVVRRDQFILSRIDARNGAFGVVPESLDGAVVSNDFPAFFIDTSRLEPDFLGWLSKTRAFVDWCKTASEGTTNRVRLKEDRFLATKIPLPPLPEQRRIVARVEAVAERVAEARRLRGEAVGLQTGIVTNEASRLFSALARAHPVTTFGKLNPHVTSGPRNWAARYVDSGMRFYRAQDILREGRIANNGKVFIDQPDSAQGQGARLVPGDLMLVITGATVGRVAVYTEELEQGYVSQHVAICRLPEEVLPRFALWRLLSGDGQAQLLGQRYGQGKPGLNLTNIRQLTIPLPPPAEQRRVVAHLDSLQARVDALRGLQAGTAAELDALLPSVLARAFAGQL
jgi:type I restriction enzyme S subunit